MPGPNFFRFNGWDWGLFLATLTVVAGASVHVVGLIVDAKVADLRVDYARTETAIRKDIESLAVGLQAHREEIDARIETYRSEMKDIVAAGLESRSDEIRRALVAGLDAPDTVFEVRVGGVPTDAPVYAELEGLIATFDGPKLMLYGDTAAFEFHVRSLDDPAARRLQTVLLKTIADPAISATVDVTAAAPEPGDAPSP